MSGLFDPAFVLLVEIAEVEALICEGGGKVRVVQAQVSSKLYIRSNVSRFCFFFEVCSVDDL